MDHRQTRLATQSRIESRRAESPRTPRRSRTPAPAGSTARNGASSASASRLPSSARPGSAGHDPITRPSHGIPWAASASNVSAVWFSVPSPAATTTRTGAPRSTATSRSVTPSSPSSTSSPPAPSTSVRLTSPSRAEATSSTARGQRQAGPLCGGDRCQRLGISPRPTQIGHARIAAAISARSSSPGGCRSAPVCTPRRRCRPAAHDTPAPPSPPSCRRRYRCR